MRKLSLLCGALLLAAGVQTAQAAVNTYNVTTIWFEPETQPRDSIFKGTFSYDSTTHVVSNLQGLLSESMTGTNANDMVWLTLSNQLVSWYDSSLGGTFAATFKNTNTNTFSTMLGGDGWSPQAGVDIGGVYYNYPVKALNPGNAYALIFVPDSPTAALTQSQFDKVAYADCAPLVGPGGINSGGMMGAVCMTGTSVAGYGAVGSMSGYPVSQTITMTAAVPEPETYAMLLAGLGLMGAVVRRRRQSK